MIEPSHAPRRAGPTTVATARQKFHCPACGAEAQLESGEAGARSVRSAAPSRPATLQTRGADTVIVEHDLVAALRNIPDAARGWQAAEDLGSMPELPGDLGLRSRQGRPALRVLRLGRSSCRTSRSRMRSVPSRCCR